jgi:outer membrane protein assembly factor BamB
MNGVTVVSGSDASKILVRDAPASEFRSVGLPAPLGAPAVAIGGDLLIPGVDGRVYLIDPRTGTSAADPYVPPFDRSKPIRWRKPVLLEGSAVAIADSEATIRRLSVDRTGRPRLAVTAEARLDSPMATDPASTGDAVVIVTVDGRVRSLAARDLGPQGGWPLEAPRLLGPMVVADHAFVIDAEGTVVAFGPDGRRLWSARLPDMLPAGPPSIRDGSAWFLGVDGSIHRLSMSDGTTQSRVPLRVLPVGGPLAAGPDLALPTGPGTLRLLDRKALGETPGGTRP